MTCMKSRTIFVLIVAAWFGACGGPEGTGQNNPDNNTNVHNENGNNNVSGPHMDELRSELTRLAPSISDTALADHVRGQNQLALDIYHEARAGLPNDNLFFSPHSISVALSMTYAGARGATAEAFEETLHYASTGQDVHDAHNRLDVELSARRDVPVEEDEKPLTLRVANGIFAQQDYPFETGFLDTLAQYYSAGIYLMDYENQTELSRQRINEWVEHKTEDRIQDLIPMGIIRPDTRVVLTNAIYFFASWLHTFNEDLTDQRPFTLLDASTVDVETMHLAAGLMVSSVDDITMIRLPYVGDQTSMLVLVPDEGEFAAVEARLDVDLIEELEDGLRRQDTRLSLPKFEFEQTLPADDILKALGLEIAFYDDADFSGISEEQLVISAILHKAFIKIDEEGTEAAAATAVVVGPPPSVPEYEDLVVDRPFLVLIRDDVTGVILFAGRVLDPR